MNKSLQQRYDELSKSTTVSTSKLTGEVTIADMDSINEVVSEAVIKIQQFAESGTKRSTSSSIKSKMLSVIDPNNKWAGKWMDESKQSLQEEKINDSTLRELTDKVLTHINEQREQTIEYMGFLLDIRTDLSNSLQGYRLLLKESTQSLKDTLENTREELDLQLLITRLEKSIITTDQAVTRDIPALIASTRIVVNELNSQLPDIEHDLNYNGSLKVAQKTLSGLIGMTQTIKSMTEQSGDAIRKDIQETTIDSIKMVGNILTDPERLRALQAEREIHYKAVNDTMQLTQNKIQDNFIEIKNISSEYERSKQETQNTLLTSYSKESNDRLIKIQ